MSSNFQPILNAQTIAPSGNWYIDLVMEDYKFFRCLSEVSYATTAATTGVSIDLFSGMGNPDITPYGGIPYISRALVPAATAGVGPFYGSNSAAVTMVALTAGSTSTQLARTFFYLDFPQIRLGGLVRLKFTNNDTANDAVVSFYSDVS